MDDRIKRLFKRYQDGIATDQERGIVEQWFQQYEYFQVDMDSERKDLIFSDLDRRMGDFPNKNSDRKLNINRVASYAALLLIGLSIGFLWLNQDPTPNQQKPTDKKYSTAYGVRKQVTLQDSSIVYLNAGSELIVPEGFGKHQRVVKLTGEGYFEIKKDPSRPFIIHTEHSKTTVLGTSFNIKSYNLDQEEQITVAEGKIQVSAASSNLSKEELSAQLTQNERLSFTKNDKSHFKVQQVNASKSGSWRYDQLAFENASLQEITIMLERWYGVSVRLKDPGKSCRRYTLSFNNDPINKVLDVLKKLSGITYTIHQNVILIDSKACKIP